ncbi:hypothetical protein BDF14DRAFT_1748439 [Spinellus fusiger]|nr:hypothetical protein BDF14DRAFT_1748439 [Spinellus fusiger]
MRGFPQDIFDLRPEKMFHWQILRCICLLFTLFIVMSTSIPHIERTISFHLIINRWLPGLTSSSDSTTELALLFLLITVA